MTEGRGQPFKRAKALFMQILAIRESMQFNLPALQVALGAVPEYRSRGHGGKYRALCRSVLSSTMRARSKYQPHQGKRECARRLRHAYNFE